MKTLLDKLSVEMNRVNPKGFARFNKGLSSDEIDKSLERFPIPRTKLSGLLDLLQWRNGGGDYLDDVDATFLPGYQYFSLNEIIQQYNMTQHFPQISGKYWMPFLNDFSDGYYYYDIRDQSVIFFFPEVGEGQKYKSMNEFLSMVYKCYSENVYFIDEKNNLNSDFQKEEEIMSAYSEKFSLEDKELGL